MPRDDDPIWAELLALYHVAQAVGRELEVLRAVRDFRAKKQPLVLFREALADDGTQPEDDQDQGGAEQ